MQRSLVFKSLECNLRLRVRTGSLQLVGLVDIGGFIIGKASL